MNPNTVKEELSSGIHGDGIPRLIRSRKRGVYPMFLNVGFGNDIGSGGSYILVDI
jgi:hypothetical protein